MPIFNFSHHIVTGNMSDLEEIWNRKGIIICFLFVYHFLSTKQQRFDCQNTIKKGKMGPENGRKWPILYKVIYFPNIFVVFMIGNMEQKGYNYIFYVCTSIA